MVLVEVLVCCHIVSVVFLYSTLKFVALLVQVRVTSLWLVEAVRCLGFGQTVPKFNWMQFLMFHRLPPYPFGEDGSKLTQPIRERAWLSVVGKVKQSIPLDQESVLSSTTSRRLSVPLYWKGTSNSMEVHSPAFISTLSLNTQSEAVTETQSSQLTNDDFVVWAR